jgi:peptidylprolyl isomerase
MSRSRLPLLTAALVIAFVAVSPAGRIAARRANPTILIDTVKGQIEVELLPAEAPKSVDHILALVKKNFYRGLRVHHVQPGIVQFGDPLTRNLQRTSDWGFGGSGQRIGVKEISKRPFTRGTVGYAYQAGQTPEDADSQMFILRIASPALNGKYAVLGQVTKGMDVVDKLAMADVIKNITLQP